MQAETAQTYSR